VQIGTFGTMMARAAVRDVSRALGHSYGTGDRLAKMIPFGKQGFPVTIDSAIEETPELAQAYKRDPVAREILDLAKKIEGNARHVGVHAAGVVIAPGPVLDYVPIQPDPKGGKTITQYDMYSVADEYGGVGLLKFDFLGLTNLSVLADSVARVKQRLGIDVDLDRVSLDDKKVYAMLARGETLGVFQMAGSGMTAYLKELQPTVVHDLNAMVALYRPGPMAFIPDYIARKKNPRLVTYLDPRLESILKPTYGILIYQDDVMMMAVQLAGYSWGEADKFRKAMGKKIPEEMAKQKDRFLTGTVERGMKKESAQKLWEQIETFAAYGFNKAHAASYGNLAYKTAYMKANFPVDYMASVLTADAGDVEKIHEIISECARMKIDILPPSVNESFGTSSRCEPPRTPSSLALATVNVPKLSLTDGGRISIFMLGIVAVILLKQPDTKSLILITSAACAMLFVSGVSWKKIALIVGIGTIGIVALAFIRPYVMERIQTFINPSSDPRGSSYQLQQSLIAIGSGGMFGRGLGQSVQKFSYLPEPQGDSVFAVIGEEWGFMGSAILVVLYVFLAVRGFKIAMLAQDNFGRFLVVGLTTLLVAQSFLNIASLVGLFPLTGVPLVFISHGGTSLAIALIAVGIILNVSRYQKKV
jgi:hypothetical protein